MDPMDNQYHFVLIIILTSFIIAAGISVFFTGNENPANTTPVPESYFLSSGLEPDGNNNSYIIRIMWYDDLNKTYSFQDYQSSSLPDPDTYQYSGEPPVPGAKMAMIRFLSWDGNTERALNARYIVDQDSVTSILNRYSLTSSVQWTAPVTPFVTETPEPSETPVMGKLVPQSGTVCRNTDGSYTATFGYQSLHDQPVKLPVGEQNTFLPGDKDRGQPVIFLPGIHHDVFSITYPANATNQVWSLMGRPVSVGTVPEVNTSVFIEPLFGYAPLEVRMNQVSSGGTIDNPLSGTWDLGDGTVYTNMDSLTHRYENSGRYLISHTIQNRCSQVSASNAVMVYRSSYSWTRDPDNPARIQFHDTSGGEPSVWFWDFGDGYSSWEQNPVHEYSYPGTYRAGLTVDGKHGKGSVVQIIEVEDREKSK